MLPSEVVMSRFRLEYFTFKPFACGINKSCRTQERATLLVTTQAQVTLWPHPPFHTQLRAQAWAPSLPMWDTDKVKLNDTYHWKIMNSPLFQDCPALATPPWSPQGRCMTVSAAPRSLTFSPSLASVRLTSSSWQPGISTKTWRLDKK